MYAEQNQAYKEETMEIERIYEGKVISLQKDKVTLPDGNTAFREVVKHPGAVAVLAIWQNQMVVVEQYRKALERSLIEIPAGKLDPGEQPMDAAMRELKEETGFECKELRPICSFYTSPGFADEIIHLFLAEQLTQGESRLDEDEFLNKQFLTLEQAKAYVAEGKIRDAKTITAIYAWELYQKTGRMD
ncbi:NUDIX hydrolase [Marinicrinis lubricantis]|uniref:NUDIX hydrolase n=1 Tax=Marinicrinis lubricantis TaxID=2086470 RepID=A0ABW1ISE3_9BACL